MQDLISVIIPSFNHEKFIPYTINSIINQTFKNLEMIIIDDNSTDNTKSAVLSLENECRKRFVNFDFIEKKQNRGINDSLNIGIEAAKGKYVYIIASDDIAKPEAIETLYSFIKDKADYALITGDGELIDENNNRIFWDHEFNPHPKYDPVVAKYKTTAQRMEKSARINFLSEQYGDYKTLLWSNYITNGYLLRKSALIEAGKYREDVLEDWYMNLQLAKKYKFKFIDKVLFSYRWHSSNAIRTESAQKKYLSTLLYEKDYCFKHNLKEEWEKAFEKYKSIMPL